MDSRAVQDSTGELLPAVFDFSQGHLTQTGRSLDLALSGEGFFVIETPQGPMYTRHGVFQTNQDGQIVDSEGRLVGGDGGPLVVPATLGNSQVSVSSDGQIRVDNALIGRLRIVAFPDKEAQLMSAGLNCWYAPLEVEPLDAENTRVMQGYQEASNVKLIDELVNMIMVTRIYEANVKLVNVTKDATRSVLGVAMG